MSLMRPAPMSLKRPLSPTSLPPSKRRRVESWIETGGNDYPHDSIETAVTPLSAPPLDDDYPASVSTISAENDGGINSSERSQSVAALQDALMCRRIFEASLDQTPSNWEELKLMVAAPRTSPEPTQDDYRSVYEVLRTRGSNEATYYDRVVEAKYFRRIWERSATINAMNNQLWTDYVPVPIPSEESYTHITTPKPDISIGLFPDAFEFWPRSRHLETSYALQNGKKAVGCYDAIRREIRWPVITIELKSEQKPIGKAIAQNAHNGAVMTANLMRLKERAGLEIPYGCAFVLSISMDMYTILVSAHWAILDANGRETFLHKVIQHWSVKLGDLTDLIESRRAISNCIERHMDTMMAMICSDLQLVKARTFAADTVQPEPTTASTEKTVETEVKPLPDATPSRVNATRRKATVSMDFSAEQARIGRTFPATDLIVNNEDELGA